MNKLLQAMLYRMMRGWLFWGLIAMFIPASSYITYSVISDQFDFLASVPNIDAQIMMKVFTSLHIIPLILMVIFVPVFFGRLFSDGTIRNMITSGHKRSSIYASCLIITAMLDAVLTIASFLLFAIVCLFCRWSPPAGLKTIVTMVLLNALIMTCYTALVLAVLFISRKRTAAIITGFISVLLATFMAPSMLILPLILYEEELVPPESEEYQRYVQIMENGGRDKIEERFNYHEFTVDFYYEGEKLNITTNKNVIPPPLKHALITAAYLDPAMSGTLYAFTENPDLLIGQNVVFVSIASSTLWTAVCSFCGIIVFRKKEIT